MASLPTAQVFPAPFIQRVPPTGMITVCRVPLFSPPGGQTVFMSPVLAGQGMPQQLHGPNIITTAQIPASNGILMSPQPVVMAPALHVARSAVPTMVPRGGPKRDPYIMATLTPSLEKSRSPSSSKKRGALAGGSSRVIHAVDEAVLMDVEDADENVLESSLKENGDKGGDSSSQYGEEQQEKEDAEAEERVSGKEEEEDKEGRNEKNIDHGDITFEIEDVSSASEGEEENVPKNKTPTRPPPSTTASRVASNGGVVASPGPTVLLPQQPFAVPNVFLPGNRVYQVVVPAGVHSNGAVDSSQVMSVQQLFSQVKVEPYQQVKLVSVDTVNPVIGKEKSKQGSMKVCSHCGTTDTPLWRRTPEGRFICNACGIYWKTNHIHRPVRNSKKPSRSTKTRDACCANCGTSVTSLWRRDHEGQTVCNACGLYYKLHKENRPIKLKKDHIKTRKRRCRGSEDLEQATAAAHLTSSYSTMQHYPTTQGYVMMASTGIEPQRDQHSPLSDGSVTMVTTSAAPTSTQNSVY